jgi:hypothetical protein
LHHLLTLNLAVEFGLTLIGGGGEERFHVGLHGSLEAASHPTATERLPTQLFGESLDLLAHLPHRLDEGLGLFFVLRSTSSEIFWISTIRASVRRPNSPSAQAPARPMNSRAASRPIHRPAEPLAFFSSGGT